MTGHATVRVHPQPSVAVLSTGDEIVSVDQTPGPGQIRNTNGSHVARTDPCRRRSD